MKVISLIYKPDIIGSIASTLCLIHCLATPFIFITQACTLSCCAGSPTWWQSLDYIFLAISFFAIFRATQTSSNKMIKIALWVLWITFCALIFNKTLGILYINQNIAYITGSLLAVLHLYNLKYCQCESETCCVDNKINCIK